ncbi:hypothetical protein K502DRAFT_234533 [Neoconidiobolus thromboides FSU 785]|nr:hypothetical protein K502DRAFT_234533 [Neoconidiobolus thromboides FSU 785]
MEMLSGQIAMIIASVIGLVLNLLVGAIVTIGLQLKSIDLKMIAIISLTDIIFYFWNILRVILNSTNLVPIAFDILHQTPTWWCPLDFVITMTCLGTSVELVAILGLIRYTKICCQKELPSYVWYGLVVLSFSLSIALALGNEYYGYYFWSRTQMFCLVAINTNIAEGLLNYQYYLIFYCFYAIRSIIALVIIAFCYFKVTTVYRQALKSTITINLKKKTQLSDSIINQNNDSEFIPSKDSVETFESESPEETAIMHRSHNLKINRNFATIKMMSASLAYMICLLPDVILTILDLGFDSYPGPSVATASNVLLCFTGVVSALFVLLSHAPSREFLVRHVRSMF